MNVLEIKAAVRARDENRCVECGLSNDRHIEIYGRSLDVHRVEPGSEYTVEGCWTLCRRCHGPKPKRTKAEMPPDTVRFLRLPPSYHDALGTLAKKSRRTLTAEAMIALERYFAENGLPMPEPE